MHVLSSSGEYNRRAGVFPLMTWTVLVDLEQLYSCHYRCQQHCRGYLMFHLYGNVRQGLFTIVFYLLLGQHCGSWCQVDLVIHRSMVGHINIISLSSSLLSPPFGSALGRNWANTKRFCMPVSFQARDIQQMAPCEVMYIHRHCLVKF